jgi:hypothetical protein
MKIQEISDNLLLDGFWELAPTPILRNTGVWYDISETHSSQYLENCVIEKIVTVITGI